MAHVRVTHSFDMGAVRVMQNNHRWRSGPGHVPAGAERPQPRPPARRRGHGTAARLDPRRTGPATRGRRARVGSNVEYAAYHHQGHGEIVPKRPSGVLVFKPRGGRWSSRSGCDRSRAPTTSERRSRRRAARFEHDPAAPRGWPSCWNQDRGCPSPAPLGPWSIAASGRPTLAELLRLQILSSDHGPAWPWSARSDDTRSAVHANFHTVGSICRTASPSSLSMSTCCWDSFA